MHFNELILVSSLLLISAILFNKIGGKFGLPSLVIFILVGILAGSDGILGIHFENYILSQQVGIIAISYILFMGGLSFNTKDLKPIATEGVILATLGVLITGIVVGSLSFHILNLPFLSCLLLGAIISSTDAAAVFSVLRSKSISLKGNLKPLLEFESGSNDPMAVFLTLGTIGLITSTLNIQNLFFDFFKQMIIGIIGGLLIAKITVYIINKIKLEYHSLYFVITIACVLFTYSSITIIGGNGFIAVYVCGLAMANLNFVNKKSLIKFHDAIAWLAQIMMFLILGLLVNFKEGFNSTLQAFYIALILIFIARPIAVFLICLPFKRNVKETLMVSWVGLRGAAPIVLATFPLAAKIPNAYEIFNIVFFVVLISVLLQGTTIPFIAKLLKVDAPIEVDHSSVLEYEAKNTNNKIFEFQIPKYSAVIDKQLFEINLPENALVSLVYQDGKYIVPGGNTQLKENDTLFILADVNNEDKIKDIICKTKET